MIAEADTAGNITARYTPGVDYQRGPGGYYFYRENGIGNTLTTTDTNGALVSLYEYDAFGWTYGEGQSLATSNQTPYLHAGKSGYYADYDSGMELLGRRYYLPKLGRFLTQDPMGQEAGLNLYEYVHNNPLGGVDPTGLQSSNDPNYGKSFHVNQAAIAREAAINAAIARGDGLLSFHVSGPRRMTRAGEIVNGVMAGLSLAGMFVGEGALGELEGDVAGAAEASTGASSYISVFHKGELVGGQVVPRIKPFSVGTAASEVDAAVPGNAAMHEFRIPDHVLVDWMRRGWAIEYRTSMNGVSLREFQFRRPAQGLLNEYKVHR